MGYKLIAVKEDTYEELCKLGRFGESFDELLRRLLNQLGIPVEDKVRK